LLKEFLRIKQMDEKPWLSLSPNDESKWWIASKNLYLPDSLTNNNQIVKAYFIIQDGNMGGSYFRYFYWLYGSDQRYFDVNSKWLFDVPISNLKTGDTVVDARTQQKYIVNDKFNNPYVKILEIA
jgi:hypothetical protein